jgi:prevent-host-death family protein
MKKVAATELKNHLGACLEAAIASPVIVEKSGRASVVLISISEYERLLAAEDAYWGERAKVAEASGFIGKKAANKLIKNALNVKA